MSIYVYIRELHVCDTFHRGSTPIRTIYGAKPPRIIPLAPADWIYVHDGNDYDNNYDSDNDDDDDDDGNNGDNNGSDNDIYYDLFSFLHEWTTSSSYQHHLSFHIII